MLKQSLLLTWRRFGRLTRIFLEFMLLLVIAGAVVLLTLRYRVLPEIERYHEQITLAASHAIGQPLTIGRIEADWDGLRPRLLLSDVQILDKQGKVALNLPRLENTVAWTSLPAVELRFHQLSIDHPDLSVRRDAQGHWFVAGIALEAQTAQETGDPDWLLHQSSVVIRNGRINWQDDLRAAPPLVLENVDLVIKNGFGRHRFALRALPPADLSSRLDLRGNFYGDSFAEMGDWSGELYTQLDYVAMGKWKTWLALPDAFKRGKGAVRLWLGFESGRLSSVDSDVALAGVLARLSEDLPQLDLKELRGRIGWHALDRGFEVSTHQLALLMRDGFELKPTDFYLRRLAAAGFQKASGEIRANDLRFSTIARLTAYMPMNEGARKLLAEANPRGHIADLNVQWQGEMQDISLYQVNASFDDLSMNRVGDFPGFSGLSGEVEGSDSSGTLKLVSKNLMLDAPQLFSEQVKFDRVSARLGWHRNFRGLEIKLSNMELSNADLAGTIYGSYQFEPEGPGSVDATVDMHRVVVKKTAFYTPVPAVNKQTRDWLQAALLEGQADKFHVRLRGDLRDFPFVGNERGVFRLEARAHGVVMDFAKGWPHLEDAQTQLLIEGNKLEVKAVRATTVGARLHNVKVSIPDLLQHDLLLQVNGVVADSTQKCLDYIAQSPVNGYLEGFTEGVKARGDGKLNLQLEIPLAGEAPIKLLGEYRFENNDVDFGENVPLLRNVNGILQFTESTLNASDIAAQILGGAAHLSVETQSGAMVTRAYGKLDLDNLNRIAPQPILQRIRGSTDWKANVRVKEKLVDVMVDSDLLGIAADLPIPIAKQAKEIMPFSFEQKSIDPSHDELYLQLGNLFDARLEQFKGAGGVWMISGGGIVFGGSARGVGGEGIKVSGRIPQLSLEGWSRLGLSKGEAGLLPNISGVDVIVNKLTGYGNTVSDLDIRGSGRNGLLSLRLASRELNGDLIWQPQGNGKLLGRFKNAILGEGRRETATITSPPPANAESPDNSGFPQVDVVVEKLTYRGRQLGRLEMEMSESGGDVILDHLKLTNPDGEFNMSGKWQASPEQTQVKLRVDISDAGRILSRSGYPDSLKDGSGTLQSELHWAGAPDTFDNAKLNGSLNLKVGKGRFLKVEPGAAKLLGVLSLQSIPRRITLDFTDVFSNGFQFDSITGNAQLVNGLLLTSDMQLTGAAAKITMSGQVDLNRETQDLRVRILPTIGDNVSLLSFAAGPAVGMGVLLANKILRDPLDKLVSFEYNVSGSWADPKVEKVVQPKAAPGATITGE